MDNVTPNKVLLSANNVKNHEEFVDVVKERLGDFLPVPEYQYERKASTYYGGETRVWQETPNINISVAYESVPWNHEDYTAFHVINTIIGSAQGFSVGGPGKGMYCRAIMNCMARYAFVDLAGGINLNFSDSGLWGMSMEGPGSHAKDLMLVLLQELH